MFDQLFTSKAAEYTTVYPIIRAEFDECLAQLSTETQHWFSANQFKAKPASVCLMPDQSGQLAAVYVGVENAQDYWSFGVLSKKLPAGYYRLAQEFGTDQAFQICLAWGLGAYQFDRYRKADKVTAKLVLPNGVDAAKLQHMLESFTLARDLINTPAEDLRPNSYADIAKAVAKECSAKIHITDGKTLQKEFPGVHTVGRAGEQPPCLVDINWGDTSHPKLTLVGKGVCFDSGGLDIKPAAGMREMKKDMGGSAIMLALARLIMKQNLPVRLRVILPIVENAIAGNSYRPGDVIRMRSGKTVEVGNTDAEGRLILADALALACEDKPDYLIDAATLTGAARVAMGPDIPAYFSNSDVIAGGLNSASAAVSETVCRLPLYAPYKELLKSDIADIHNISSTPYGGAITAALFLQHFVDDDVKWAHFDVMAANTRDLPGRPKGGEAHALRVMYRWVTSLVIAKE